MGIGNLVTHIHTQHIHIHTCTHTTHTHTHTHMCTQTTCLSMVHCVLHQDVSRGTLSTPLWRDHPHTCSMTQQCASDSPEASSEMSGNGMKLTALSRPSRRTWNGDLPPRQWSHDPGGSAEMLTSIVKVRVCEVTRGWTGQCYHW